MVTGAGMKVMAFKYPSKEDSENGIDKIFSYMDKHNIDIEDYRVQRINSLPKSGLTESVIYLSLGIRIQYKDNIESDIRSFMEDN
jgi:hypothetical protein